MKRKIITAALAAGIALLAAALCVGRRPERPNVLLVSIDSLRADHVGCYGYGRPTSPHLDKLASEGAVFLQAASPTSWTLPAHVSIFTGLEIGAHGVASDGFALHRDIPTLPELLKKEGYVSGAVCTSPYLNPAFGFGRGFDYYHNTDADLPGYRDTILPDERERDRVHAEVTGGRVAALAARWLEENRGKPFFLFLHFWDVHYDYTPPPPYDRLFDPDYAGPEYGRNFINDERVHAGMPRRELEHILALYDGEIAWTDHNLGTVIAKLQELGEYENTLIVVTADHGDEFFEHGGKGHRASLYDEVIMVPLVIRPPGPAGPPVRAPGQVSLIDLAPTILDYALTVAPGEMQGRSLRVPAEGGAVPAPAGAFLELPPALAGLRTPGWKALHNLEASETVVLDLAADPKETHRPLLSGPAAARAEAEFRRRWGLNRLLGSRLRGNAPGAPVELDEAARRRLETLGYL